MKATRLWVLSFAVVLIRAQADETPSVTAAQREFLDFHLFAEGRGMALSPRLAKKFRTVANSPLWPLARFQGEQLGGMIPDGRKFIGQHDDRYGGSSTIVFGCVMCHAGKAAGRFVPGLGNKNIDPYAGAQLLAAEWEYDRRNLRRGTMTNAERAITENALRYAALVSRNDLANPVQGLVSLAWIMSWVYEATGRELPNELRIPGATKVPHLWGYERKRAAGLFYDGMGDGGKAGWLAVVPLTAGLPTAAVRANYSALLRLEKLFSTFQPPAYPFSINHTQADEGADLFARNCQGCHGNYSRDPDGTPHYEKPHWVPIDVVGTDRERLRLTSGLFREVVAQNPLREIIRSNPHAGRGYFAPRLEGIWARFPYLHNGSAPNLRALLTTPVERPRLFSVKRAGEADRFDAKAVGLKVPAAGSIAGMGLRLAARGENRTVYDTSRAGQSNQGHPFGTELSENDKASLIEYLKTL